MTAKELDDVLAVCRKHGLATVTLVMGGDTVSCTFGPDPLDEPAQDPGGWKAWKDFETLDAAPAEDKAPAPRNVE